MSADEHEDADTTAASGSPDGSAGTEELVASNPNANGPDGAAGDMGVSSERTGPTGPGQHGTDGQLDTSPGAPERDADGNLAPQQTAGSPEAEVNPDYPGPPRSGYNSRDPRSEDHPFEPGPEHAR